MPGFLREHSWSIAFSVGLHGLLIAAFAAAALITIHQALPTTLQPIPVDAVVIDSQVLHAAQRALTERSEQEAARLRAAAEEKAAAQAAEVKAATDAKLAAEEERAAEETKAAAAEAELMKQAQRKQAQAAQVTDTQKAAAAKRAEDLKRADEAKRAEEAKRAADAKQDDDAKRAAELKAKTEREAELRRQLADEEHVSAVEASPARAQYLARLSSSIQNAWIKPPSARAGLDCIVNITQIPGGEVTGAHVSQCNGDAAARQSIENAVLRASPLPPPPDPALFQRNLVIHFHPDE
jgi:colicin import membrane protein